MKNRTTFRFATADDVPLILYFIRELAQYEALLHEVIADEEQLHRTLFGERAYAEVVFALWDGKPVGFALFFHNYSTFLGKPGLYIEDLFIEPEHRGSGIGKALLSHIACLAKERDCGRVEWWVLDWNAPSIGFYKKIGALPMDEWTVFRLTGESLDDMAALAAY